MAGRVLLWCRTAPPWLVVVVLYAVSRLVSSAWLGGLFAVASANDWDFASPRREPSFFTFSGSWDASFYRTIARDGYPTELPTDADGAVKPNPWAFLPVFPAIVRGLMQVLGVDPAGQGFYTVGVVVATIAGGAAAVVLHRLVTETAGSRSAATWAVALFCFGPVSFVLQVVYAESLMLFLLFACLLAQVRRQYLVMIPFGVVAAFTRPGVLAVALALAVHGVVRLVREGARPGFPLRQRVELVVAGLVIAAAGLAWPVIADAVTGLHDAYLDTELSWWTGFVGAQSFTPLTPWFVMATTFLGWAGVVLVLAVLALVVWFLTRPSTRSLGVDVVAFAGSYVLYLVAVFLPQQSLPRLLMPLAPVLGTPAIARSPRLRTSLLVGGAALQPVAVVLLWFVGYP
ncbi:mannosyltransferase family protein [Frigoribacterium sp. 2-23]|uniref:mannosyltransferase family protein n=1 Tax=Frigoribacterium sp. 2-23 TaxID=3415006 RepID=UPI003C701C87